MTNGQDKAALAGPLAGVRVIDLSAVLMGPYATQIFGDHGADVIKIESPEGDSTRHIGPGRNAGMGPMFLHLNRNKRSVVLDLKQPGGLAAMRRLIAEADVFIHNLRPASIERLGLDFENVSALNPRIVWCGMYGYGEDGPYAGRPAYDDLIQGAVGIADLQRRAGLPEPRYVPLTIADRMVGLHAAHSVAMALYARERTGRGCRIDVPMFETMASVVLSDHLYGHTFEPPSGGCGYVRLLSPGRRPYATSDGYICALVYNDGHWQRFLRSVERDDLLADPRFADLASRTRHIDEVYGFLGETLRGCSSAHWLALFERIDVPAMPLNTMESLLDDPHLSAVSFFQHVEHPSEGPLRTFGVPARWVGHDVSELAPAPRLGEHTAAVLRESGCSASDIEALVASGAAVVTGP
ncbi:CaiB/BaiF CoA transferase family protein [Variovorax sp. DAIF25]|uniref:CaiB/BaiF CoA transferase family protein n=1 Tax=Variovorax sp. DAIF25 TaxID=3080983 RepID=UPI003D6BA0B1